ILGQLGLIRSLRGSDGNARPEMEDLERRLQKDRRLAIVASWYWIRQLQARFHAGDYAAALRMAATAESLTWTGTSFFEWAEYHFYCALAHAQAHDSAREEDAPGHREAVAKHQAQLASWAEGCAETFASRAALAAAELARLEERVLDAERLYEESIQSARAAGFTNVEAIACELAARFHRRRGFRTIAEAVLVKARAAYARWGAEAVVRRLDEELGGSREPSASHTPTKTTSLAEGLDLSTAIKASQAVSGEILIDKLVETLMVTAIQHAGADRGLLIVRVGEESRIEAEARAPRDGLTVSFRGVAPEPADVPDSLLRYVIRTREPLIIDDASAPTSFAVDPYLVERRARSILCLPLVKQTTLVGVLYLENNLASHVFTPERTELLKMLASQAAISLENARLYSDLHEAQAQLAEAQRLSKTSSFGWRPSRGELVWSDEAYRIFEVDRATKPTAEFVLERTHSQDRERLRQLLSGVAQEAGDWDIAHRIVMPDGRIKHLRVMAHAQRDESSGEVEHVGFAMDITTATESRQALEKAYGEIQALKEQLQNENVVLREEVDKASMFEEIIGGSRALKAVLRRVEKVAPTDSTVLITGETGTGKELIARAIHKRSPRSGRAFIGVNCAAIPASVIASELVGHEKGAFTGALQQRLGRFELAQGGTIFLDEIGELPHETQIALLRVLQEHEFEHVGGNRRIRADARVIVATNRDLAAAIAAGTFRSDLFYRVNVFPIEMPSLRERREDIPLLVEYFIDRFARQSGKKIRRINKATLETLQSYPWPGNIRELQNVIERSVIVCDTDTFSVDESWLALERSSIRPASRGKADKVAAQVEERATI